MAVKTVFTCTSCGRSEPKWMGRCPECGEWNTFEEQVTESKKGKTRIGSKPVLLKDVQTEDGSRLDTGIKEVNQVLGGGLMPGSSVLFGGEPGIGKSTLMLQIASSGMNPGKVLYISGEESAYQVKLRADRLDLDIKNILILCETDPDRIKESLDKIKPALLIVDSIQTLFSSEAGKVPGSINQLKYGTYEIINWCKQSSCSVFFIAHVTKDGIIAGPRVIEHMVDTVMYFERAETHLRVLRAAKNRFGATDEVGLFSMTEKGLSQVINPATTFLVNRNKAMPAGTAVASVYEGSRVLLVEIQALVVASKSGISRVFSDRLDVRRISRIAAVLEKHNKIRLSDHDIYINIAGGLKISEVGLDLPLAMALYSARTGIQLPEKTALAGEISLSGEIRDIPHLDIRKKTCKDLGFTRFIGPSEGNSDGPIELSVVIKKLFTSSSK